MTQNKSLSTQEVADMLHVSKSTIYDLVRRGEIRSYKIGRKVRFTQDDVDGYIARSRHEQRVQPARRVAVSSSLMEPEIDHSPPLVISGQDVLLDILANHLREEGVNAARCHLSSFEGLLSLYQGRVDATACHLWAAEEKDFNAPFVRKLMPGVPAILVNLSYRAQGFYVRAGNPKRIKGWQDLKRADVSLINRRVGSSARILLDWQMLKLGLSPQQVRGYERELQSHLTVASAIANGEADLAIGTERVARRMDGVDFIPLLEDRYDLVMRKEQWQSPEMRRLMGILRSDVFLSEIDHFSGNDYRDLGKVVAEV